MIAEIQKQLSELIAENQKGSTALFDCEVSLAKAELELDTTEAKAFIAAAGTVADRNAVTRLQSSDLRFQRDLRKAELNRVKVKIKSIETAIFALGSQAKLIQSEMKL